MAIKLERTGLAALVGGWSKALVQSIAELVGAPNLPPLFAATLLPTLLSLVVINSAGALRRRLATARASRAMLARATAKRAARDTVSHACLADTACTDALAAVSPEDKRRVLSASVRDLRAIMALGPGNPGGLSCVQVLLLFVERTGSLGRACGAVAEEAYDEAVSLARAIDGLPRPSDACAATAQASPWHDLERFPLLGVPVSIKDQINMKGIHDSSSPRVVSLFTCRPSVSP